MRYHELRLQTVESLRNSGRVKGEILMREHFGDIKAGKFLTVISELRKYKKGSKEYDSIKRTLPGIIPNCFVYKRRHTENVIACTGLIYIDLDFKNAKQSDEFKQSLITQQHIVAIQKSAGGTGQGIFVAAEGVTPFNFKNVYKHITSLLDLPFDEKCNDVVRCNVVSSDPDIYVNLDAIPVNCKSIPLDDDVKKIKHLSASNGASEQQYYYRPVIDIHYRHVLARKEIKIVDQGNGAYLIPEGLEYFELWGRVKQIPVTRRNITLTRDLSMYALLNKHKSTEQFRQWLHKRNELYCREQPLEVKELERILTNVVKELANDSLYVLTRKLKYTWFSSNCNLSTDEKKSRAAINKRIVNEWKMEQALKAGKINTKQIMAFTHLSYHTVHRFMQTVKGVTLIAEHRCKENSVDYQSFDNSVTPSIKEAIDVLLTSAKLILRKTVSQLSGKSERQVVRRWKPFKEKIDAHNKNIIASNHKNNVPS